MMTGTPSLRRAVLVLLGLIALLTTAGCVNLPANTSASVVANPAKGGSGADVRIWPQAPQRGASPEQIVEGFIQTAASDPSNLPITQDYLTGDAANNWHPNRVVVFSDVSSPVRVAGDAQHVKVEITGTEVATVSDNGAYQQILNPRKENPYSFDLTFDPTKDYYRIDRLPGVDFGILLTQEAFRANYATYYLYYLNNDKPDSSMIPVPDYQRSQTGDAATAQNLINALLAGPPEAMAGIASVAAPKVGPASPVTITPNNTAFVPIKSPTNCTAQGKRVCTLLADEMLATLSNLASVNNVTLVDLRGNPLMTSSGVDRLESRYHIAVSAAKNTSFYYLDSKTTQVSRFDSNSASSNPTSVEQVGPLTRKYSQIAVSDVAVGNNAPQTYAAVVDDKGSKLYVGMPGQPKDTPPVYTAAVGHHISSLSWDAFGHLWFLDTAGAAVSLYRLDMTAQPKPVLQAVPVTGDSCTISRIAVAPDGLRIAVSCTPDGFTGDSVVVAMVEEAGSSIEANLSFGLEQPVVNGWTSVSDVSWHGGQALAVLGASSPSSPETVSELNSDGSPVISAADLNPVVVNPPTGTVNIEWTGAALLASTHSSAGNAVSQYSFTNGAWTSDAAGFSPTYTN